MNLVEQLQKQGYNATEAAKVAKAFKPREFKEEAGRPGCQSSFACQPIHAEDWVAFDKNPERIFGLKCNLTPELLAFAKKRMTPEAFSENVKRRKIDTFCAENRCPTCPLTNCVKTDDDDDDDDELYDEEDDILYGETEEDATMFFGLLDGCGFVYEDTLTVEQLIDVVEAYDSTLEERTELRGFGGHKKTASGMKWVFGKLVKLGKRLKTKGKKLLKKAVKGAKAKWHAHQAKKHEKGAHAAVKAAHNALASGDKHTARKHLSRAKKLVRKGEHHAKKAGHRIHPSRDPEATNADNAASKKAGVKTTATPPKRKVKVATVRK